MFINRINLTGIIISSIFLAACGGGGSNGGDGSSASNTAPVLSRVGTQYTTKNTAKEITLSASDSENDVITYEAGSQLPDVSLSVTGNVLTVTPTSGWTGSSTITVSASDGALSDTDSFIFTVLEVSKPPSVSVTDNSIPVPPAIPAL